MKTEGRKEAKDIVDSFVKDVLANFFVIISTILLMLLWVTLV